MPVLDDGKDRLYAEPEAEAFEPRGSPVIAIFPFWNGEARRNSFTVTHNN